MNLPEFLLRLFISEKKRLFSNGSEHNRKFLIGNLTLQSQTNDNILFSFIDAKQVHKNQFEFNGPDPDNSLKSVISCRIS